MSMLTPPRTHCMMVTVDHSVQSASPQKFITPRSNQIGIGRLQQRNWHYYYIINRFVVINMVNNMLITSIKNGHWRVDCYPSASETQVLELDSILNLRFRLCLIPAARDLVYLMLFVLNLNYITSGISSCKTFFYYYHFQGYAKFERNHAYLLSDST